MTKDQGDTCLIVKEEFFPFHNSRLYQSRDSVAEDSDEGNRHHDLDNSDIEIFECSEPGCVKSFQLFSELEAHLDVGDHCVEAERQSETLYDTIRTDWQRAGSGLKADPQQVSNDMRKARDEQNRRLFEREEWLTKSQVQGFFSRLSANRRRQHAPSPEGEQSSTEGTLSRGRRRKATAADGAHLRGTEAAASPFIRRLQLVRVCEEK